MMDSLAAFIRPPTIYKFIYLGASKIERDGSWIHIPHFPIRRYNVFDFTYKEEYELERLAQFLLIVNILDSCKDLRRFISADLKKMAVFLWILTGK